MKHFDVTKLLFIERLIIKQINSYKENQYNFNVIKISEMFIKTNIF
jgi:hypothetical protein